MKFQTSSFQPDRDYDQLRQFLRDAFFMNNHIEMNWFVQRFDYFYWHIWKNCLEQPPQKCAIIVRDDNANFLGAIFQESFGAVALQTHPHRCTKELLAFMVERAEETYFKRSQDGGKKLYIACELQDKLKTEVLLHRGYRIATGEDRCGRIYLPDFEPVVTVPEGFSLRSLGTRDELPARSWVSWRAFHPNEPDEKYEGWEWYLNIQKAPLYKRDLDIVAVADDGTLAGFVTIWFDDVTRSGYFEPVGVEPIFHRRGIARAMLHEGLRRLKEIEAQWAFLDSNEGPVHTIYDKCGFKETLMYKSWLKEF